MSSPPHVPIPSPANASDPAERARAALRRDAASACATHLARVAGTHALMLDATGSEPPAFPGIARWTVLHPGADAVGWDGPLRADAGDLPFADDSFCAVLVHFVGTAGVVPDVVAGALARTLSPHGVLLVADLHAHSFWPGDGLPPQRWERALRCAGLDVVPAARCGSPWPRSRGAGDLPRWLVHALGGAYVIAARRRSSAAIPLRRAAERRRTVEHGAFVPGARRQCA